MAVEMVSEFEHDAHLRLVPQAEEPAPALRPDRPETAPAPQPARPVFPAREVMSVIEVLLKALGLRMLLAAAFAAMAWLGYMTVADPTPTKIWAMAIWAILGFLPLVMLVRQRG